VLYCTNGLRSSFAIDDLKAAGYTNPVNGGGYAELQRALAGLERTGPSRDTGDGPFAPSPHSNR
jgi:rhodanese-related sulfurtransferase